MAFEEFWMSEQTPPTGGSLRFSGAQYLQRPVGPGAPTNGNKATLSMWVKRGSLGANSNFFSSSSTAGSTYDSMLFRTTSDDFRWVQQGSPMQFDAVTNAVYRDPGAWYHLVFVQDGNNATPSNRNIVYVNGVAQSLVAGPAAYGVNPPQTASNGVWWTTPSGATANNKNTFGALDSSGTGPQAGFYFDGYISDAFLVDGQALLPTAFGYFDSNNVWVPYSFNTAKANVIATGGFGTNGFALEFKSSNFTSGTNVWADQSGNGNNFTASWDCAVGAGGGTTGTDIMSDSPITNYAVINPLYQGSSTTRANLTTANSTGKPTILPAYANSGTVPQTVGVNGAGVSWNGTEAGWTSTGNISFGQQSTFTGATGLSASKLTAASITNGATGFQAILDTGANILSTAQATFPNGLWWVKDRVNANNHQLVDSVRGGNLALLTPGNVTVNTPQEFAYVPPTGNSVAWCWATDATGLNTSTGFQIVSYTGNGSSANRQISHNLGATPGMIFVKCRGTNNTSQRWFVWHSSLTAGNNIFLDSSDGQGGGFINGGLNLVTSTYFTLVAGSTNNNNLNGGGKNYISYVWAPTSGYSAFGSYTGNGSTDGPFVYTGFKPAFVLFKCSTQNGTDWMQFDSTRNPYNVTDLRLSSNQTTQEVTNSSYYFDMLSNGFKIRGTSLNFNTSGQTYIYAAFAENPFGGSNVAPVTAR